MIVFTPTYADSIILLGLFALLGFLKHLKAKEPKEVNIAIKKEVADLKAKVDSLKLDKSLGAKKQFKF